MLDRLSPRSGPGWYVAQIAPQRDRRAADGIKALGFEIFAPIERFARVRRGRRIETCRPYIPGYLFVAFDIVCDDWQLVAEVDGVIDVLRNNDIPSRVPVPWIEALRYAETVGELDRTKADPDGFAIGQAVRIAEGPFAGHAAIIQAFLAKMKSATARKRARVLMRFLGQMTTIDLPVTELEKIA